MTGPVRIHSNQVIGIGQLHPYVSNPRVHSEEQIQALMGLIREFGFTNPILLDERDMVIAGHGRMVAAERLGMTTVPYVRVHGLSDAQKRAYIIADNKAHELSSWDQDLLTSEFNFLNAYEFDVSTLGFREDEVAYFLNAAALDDAVPTFTEPSNPESTRNTEPVSSLVTFSIKLEPNDKARLLRIIKAQKERGLHATDAEALMSLFETSDIE